MTLGNFIDEEFAEDNLYLLHTYAVIYGACGLAMELDRPLLIVHRDSWEQIALTLQKIVDNSEIRLINTWFREIRTAPENGVPLSTSKNVYWGMGLYFPQ